MQLLNDAETERPEMWEAYSTAEATLAHLDKLRLLNSIEEEVNRLNKEARFNKSNVFIVRLVVPEIPGKAVNRFRL